MKRLLRLFAVLWFLSALVAAQTAVVSRNVYLRPDASTNNDPIAKLNPKTQVQLHSVIAGTAQNENAVRESDITATVSAARSVPYWRRSGGHWSWRALVCWVTIHATLSRQRSVRSNFDLLSAGALSASFLSVVERLCASCVPRRHYSCLWTRAGCGSREIRRFGRNCGTLGCK